ncbi:MAG: hypothetical protein RX318_05365 [bacterium]|nr:hypothetical protein [bacterium]
MDDKKKVELKIEELEERIAPTVLNALPPGLGSGEPVASAEVNDAARAADGQGAVSVEEVPPGGGGGV